MDDTTVPSAQQHLGILLLVASELRLVLDEASLELAGEDAQVLLGPEGLEQRREVFHELALHGMAMVSAINSEQ